MWEVNNRNDLEAPETIENKFPVQLFPSMIDAIHMNI